MWRALVALGALAVATYWAGLTCGELGGILVALGASAVALCRAVCREVLAETGGRMRRSGFDMEF